MGKYTNEEIVRGIKERRSKVFQFLYDVYFPMINSYILRNNGNEIEAEDIFQDAIIIIYEKIKFGKLKLTSSFKTYFYAICKYLWLQRLPILRRTELRDESDDSWNAILGYEEYEDFEEEKLFQSHFNQLDKDCQKILLSFFEKKPYKEIADDLNFKPNYIKKLKFICKEKLFQNIINDPVFMELMNVKKDMRPQNKTHNFKNSKNSSDPEN